MGENTERPPPPKELLSPGAACVIPTIRDAGGVARALVERRRDGTYALAVGKERFGDASPVQTAWRTLEEDVGVVLSPWKNCGSIPHTWTQPAHPPGDTMTEAHPFARRLGVGQGSVVYYHYHAIGGNLAPGRPSAVFDLRLVSMEDLREIVIPDPEGQRMLRVALEQAAEVGPRRGHLPRADHQWGDGGPNDAEGALPT